jgi:hypothetical protein
MKIKELESTLNVVVKLQIAYKHYNNYIKLSIKINK